MDNDRFARTIKNARLKKGYTQSQLADLLKVSNKTISKWETGRGYPDITLLAKITSILKLDYEELLQSNEYIIQKIVTQSNLNQISSKILLNEKVECIEKSICSIFLLIFRKSD